MSDERFARQYRYELPSGFPLTSPYSSIVHHLSGPTLIALTQTSLNRLKSVDRAKQKNPICYFHSAYRFATRTLAIEVDSLVRVSRRVEKSHLVIVMERPGTPQRSWRLSSSELPKIFPTIMAHRKTNANPYRDKDLSQGWENRTRDSAAPNHIIRIPNIR